jgi:hypothetical protein
LDQLALFGVANNNNDNLAIRALFSPLAFVHLIS